MSWPKNTDGAEIPIAPRLTVTAPTALSQEASQPLLRPSLRGFQVPLAGEQLDLTTTVNRAPLLPSQAVVPGGAEKMSVGPKQKRGTAITKCAKGLTKKSVKRRFTVAHEQHLIAAWEDNINSYYKGVRRNCIARITKSINDLLSEPPLFIPKQIENKLQYLERRYKDVKDEFSASGFGVDQLGDGSLRTTVERKFPSFFSVHEIIGGRYNISPKYLLDVGGNSPPVEDNVDALHES
eukprot:IDg23877t1